MDKVTKCQRHSVHGCHGNDVDHVITVSQWQCSLQWVRT